MSASLAIKNTTMRTALLSTTAIVAVSAVAIMASSTGAYAISVSGTTSTTQELGATPSDALIIDGAGEINGTTPAVRVIGIADSITITDTSASGPEIDADGVGIEVVNTAGDLTGGISIASDAVVTATTTGGGSNAGTGILVHSGADISGGVNNSGAITGYDYGISIATSGSISGGVTNDGKIFGNERAIRVVGGATSSQTLGGIVNTGTIGINAAATDTAWIGIIAEGANTDISGLIDNDGIIIGETTALRVNAGADISGGITNTGVIGADNTTSAAIAFATYGIRVTGNSDISGVIVNSGTIVGDGTAILVNNSSISGGIDNSGWIIGGSTSVDTAITLSGATLGSATNVGINNSNVISAYDAIYIELGSTVHGITNSGTIFGTGASAIGAIYAEDSFFAADISNNSGGLIGVNTYGSYANDTGIFFDNTDSTGGISNNGVIAGDLFGISLTNGSVMTGAITNSTSGFIGFLVASTDVTANVGINIDNSTVTGGVSNSGTIFGIQRGVQISGGGDINGITNSGNIGVNAAGTDFAVNAILVTGASSEVSDAITNTGTIRSDQAAIDVTSNADVHSIVNNADGLIQSNSADAIIIGEDATIGTTAGIGISNAAGSTSGGIIGNDNGINILGSLSGGITNTGYISGAGGEAILVDIGSVTGGISNGVGGKMTGSVNGIALASGGDVDSISNSGAIVGSGISGIVVSAGSTVSGAITNNVTGTISGANFGIGLAGAVQSGVANAGSITGLSEDGILVYGASASVTGGIVNAANASILGEDSGILIALGATVDTIGNSGSVVGTTEAGIALISAGTVTGALTNTLGGTITGESAGILVDDVSVIGSGIINAGVITATDTAGTGIKITTNSSVGSVTNSGTIAGGANGLAVQFGDSDSTLTLQTGSHLTGDADGGAGTNDTLVLEGNGVEDADFTNFESLTVSASASGTWVLSGDSNFTDLTLNSGTLDIQGTIGTTLTPLATVNLAGGELSVSNGGVLNVAAISAPSGDLDIETGTINVTSSITVGGSLNVGTTGALNAASLNVTGDADISGAVDVTGGAIVVGGALNVDSTGTLVADTVSATDVDVEGLLTTTNGVTVSGILSGSGTIAGGLVTVNGTLSPGNSPGQMDVASIALGSGSVYLVEHEVGATPVETDITVATGTVTIGTDVDVNVSVGAGSDGFEDDILTAAGGIIGTFDEITGLDGNAVGLIVYDDLITPTIATLVVAKTDALVATVGTVSDAGFVFLDNLQEGARRDGRVWASAYIYNAENEGQGTSGADYDQDAFGFNAGIDVISEPDLKVGVALGYLDGDVDINSATSEAENDAIFGAAYLNYMNDNFYLDGAVMIGQQTVDTTRTLTGGDATASVDATSYGANLEAGLELEALGGRLSPFVKVGIHSASLDAYSEAGAAGIGAMTVGEVETQQMRLGGGFRYAVDLGSEDGIQVTPTLKVGMTQEWQDTDSSAEIGFVGYTGSTTASLDFQDQTTVDLGLSFDVKLSEAITAFVGWDAALGDETTRNTGTIGLSIKW